MTKNVTRRSGITLLELLVVLAILVVLGAIAVPSMSGLHGNVRQQAATDLIRTRLADGRTRAMEDGKPYRLAIHKDGHKMRLAPDGPDFSSVAKDEHATFNSKVTEDPIDQAKAEVVADGEMCAPSEDGDWVTVATFTPEGTCKESTVTVQVEEGKNIPIRIQVRGATGTSKVLPANTNTPTPSGGRS